MSLILPHENNTKSMNIITAPPLPSNELSAKYRHILINFDEKNEEEKSKTNIICSYLLPRLFSYGTCALTAYWVYQSYDGIQLPSLIITNENSHVYYSVLTYHILGMSVFAMITNQEALLSKISPFLCSRNECVKGLSYYGSQFIGLVSVALGFAAIYYKNSLMPEADWFSFHLYSPHAWMGISTTFIWTIRQLTGLCMPHYNRLNDYLMRTTYLLGVSTCALGFQSKQTLDLMNYISNISNISNISTISNISNISTISTISNISTISTISNISNISSLGKVSAINTWFSIQPSLSTLLLAASAIATFWLL